MEQQDLIDSGVSEIAASLNLGGSDDKGTPALDEPDTAAPPSESDSPTDESQDGEAAPPAEGEEPLAAAPEVVPPPKSWAKDTHEVWAKMPPEAQKYVMQREEQMLSGLAQYREYHSVGKAINDVISPYRPMIQAAGLDDAKAVATLLNAHYRLTQGPLDQRRATYAQLGRDLGFLPQSQGEQPNEMPVDQEARQRLERLEHQLTQRQQQEMNQLRQTVTKEFEDFAKDKPYVDEVAQEMVAFINAGASLADSYERAVYANPVTRAKELARLQKESEDKIKANTRAAVDKARGATAANVKGRDTTRTPTESRGKLLDEGQMLNDLREIRERASH